MMLLMRIERFLRRSGMPPTRFGREVLNDAKLIHDLRGGRELRPGTQARILAYLESSERPA